MFNLIYPRGILGYSNNRHNDFVMCNGSQSLSTLVSTVSEHAKEAQYQIKVIEEANRLFHDVYLFIGDNARSPYITSTALTAISKLMDVVDEDIDISDDIAMRKLFIVPFSTPINKPSQKEIIEVIERRNKDEKRVKYNTANVIRRIIYTSEGGIVGLVKVLDFFFGLEKRLVNEEQQRMNSALAMLSINSVKAV